MKRTGKEIANEMIGLLEFLDAIGVDTSGLSMDQVLGLNRILKANTAKALIEVKALDVNVKF